MPPEPALHHPEVVTVVPARNEQATITNVISTITAATGRPPVVANSNSTDGTAQMAAAAGARVVEAPKGKAEAVAAACDTLLLEDSLDPLTWVVLCDADLTTTAADPVNRLHDATQEAAPLTQMVVGTFDLGEDPWLPNTWLLHDWLTQQLFPRLAGQFDPTPLSGFRAVRLGTLTGAAHACVGYGLEAQLNLTVGATRDHWDTVLLGPLEVVGKPNAATMGPQIVTTILNLSDTGTAHRRYLARRAAARIALIVEAAAGDRISRKAIRRLAAR